MRLVFGARARRELFRLRRSELGRLSSELDACFSCLLVTSILVIPAIVASLTHIAVAIVLLVPLVLFVLLSPLLLSFLLVLGLLGIILLSSVVSILLEFLLLKQEIDLHDLVGAKKQILLVHADHIVKTLGLVLVVNLEKYSQFVLALARAIKDRLSVNVLGIKTL